MADLRLFGATSNLVRFTIKDKTTGQGKTGLTGSTTGLIISTIADNEASATAYTQAAAHIQTIATLGTFAAPSASNCRFGEVDSTNHKGLYEFQIADARFAVASSKRLVISVNDAEATILDADYEIELVQFNPFDAVHLGLSSLPNTAVTTNASLLTSGTGTDQLSVTSGIAQANVEQWDSVAIAEPTTDGIPDVNVLNWKGGAVPATSQTGVPLTDPHYWNGTAFVSVATAGIPDVNVKNIVNVAAALDGNNLLKVDTEDWKGGAVPAVNVTGVPLVDLKYTLGTISPAAAGYVGIDWGQVTNKTTTNALTNTTISTTQTITSVSGSVGSVTGAVGSVTAAVTLSAGDSPVMQSGTATAGGASTITIQTALGHDTLPVGCKIKITSGTGLDQARVITAYVDTTKVVTVDHAWTTNPDATSVYSILYDDAPTLNPSLQVTVGTNTDKSGYSLAQAFPTNFSSLGISAGGHIVTVDTLTTYTGNTVQTGDAYARLGAPAGASIAADLAEIEGETDGIAAIPTNPYTGTPPTTAQIATAVWQDSTAGDFTTASSIGKSLYTSGVVPGAAGGVFIAGANAATTVNFTGNLIGTVSTLTTYTGNTPQTGDAYARLGAPVGASISADVAGCSHPSTAQTVDGTSALTESYSANGAAFTLAQGLYEIAQHLSEMSISGTTMTLKKRDHATSAETLTLNDATNPTSITRTT